MEKILNYTPHIISGVGVWLLLNGILHDIFVLASDHGKKYDRDLLRLLMDGHVLIFSGIVMMVSFNPLKENISFAYWICLIMCIGMIVYCLMIWPFLKSLATLSLTLIATALIILKLKQI